MSFSFKADNELITAIRDRAMFNTFAGNQSYVIKGIGQELAVTVTPSTLNVSVGSGEAVICGGSTIIDSDNSLTLGANESGYLVIRIDLSQTQENICQFMKVPTLIQQNINNGTDLIYDLPLYQYTTNTSTVTSLVDIRSVRDYADTSLDGGTTGQVLTKNSNNNGDFGWGDTDYMEVDTLGAYDGATPINADLLEGHNASYFQQLLSAGRGIDITDNVITNQFGPIASPDLDNINYYYAGYVSSATNSPYSGTRSGYLLSIVNKNSTGYREQMFCAYNADGLYLRRMTNGTWSSWQRISTISTPTITIGDVSNSNIIAKQQGDVVFLDGYVITNAQTYTANSTVLFTTNVKPSATRFFAFFNYTSSGLSLYIGKWQSDGKVVMNNTITFNSPTYLFFNASLPL